MKPKILIDIYKGLPEPLDLRKVSIIQVPKAPEQVVKTIPKIVEPPRKEPDVPGEWL